MNWNQKCFLNNEKKKSGNSIGYKGAIKISESLKINTTLTELVLGSNWNTTIEKMNCNKECVCSNE